MKALIPVPVLYVVSVFSLWIYAKNHGHPVPFAVAIFHTTNLLVWLSSGILITKRWNKGSVGYALVFIIGMVFGFLVLISLVFGHYV